MNEELNKTASEYIESLIENEVKVYNIDFCESNYEAGKRDALIDFGEAIFKAGAKWQSLEHYTDEELRAEIKKRYEERKIMKASVLFGMSYLYQSGDVDFYRKMAKLGLRRGKPFLCGGEHKCIIANKYEYWLSDYDNEQNFIEKFDMCATYTVEDFINKIRKLKKIKKS